MNHRRGRFGVGCVVRGFAGWALAAVLGFGLVQAQDPDYTLRIVGTETINLDGTTTCSVEFENQGSDATGVQYGVCQDSDVLSLATADFGLDGAALDTTFAAVTLQGNDGYTTGVLMNVISGAVIASGATLGSLTSADYVADGVSAGEGVLTDLELCDVLGSPEVVTAIVVGGTDITPVVENKTLEIITASFTFSLPTIDLEYRPDEPAVSFTVNASISEDANTPNQTQGFSMGISHDGSVITPTDVQPLGPLNDLNGGDGPTFFGVNLSPVGGDGLTVGVVYVALDDETIGFDVETEVLEISYDSVEAALDGNEIGAASALSFTDSLGAPEVRNTVVISGFSEDVILVGGAVNFIPILQNPFIRGDCNDTGNVDITDGIFLLSQLFEVPVSMIPCDNACNANGQIEAGSVFLGVADAIYLFDYLFLDGPEPPAPFPDCGPSELPFEEAPPENCEVFESCE